MASKAYVVAMTVSELKEELKQRGMSTKGSKKDLRDRLEQALYDEELDDPSSESESESSGHSFGRGLGAISGFNFKVPPESFIAEEDLLPDDEDDEDEDYAEPMTVSIELSNKERLEVCPRASATPRMAVGIGDRSMGDRSLNPMIVQIEIGNRQLMQEESAIGRGVADSESSQMDAATVEEHPGIVRKADARSRLSASVGINGGREPPTLFTATAARETAFEAPVAQPEPTPPDPQTQTIIEQVPPPIETAQTDGIQQVEQIHTTLRTDTELVEPVSLVQNDDNSSSKPKVTISNEKPLEAPETSQNASSQVECLPTEHKSLPQIESHAEIAKKIEETHITHKPQSTHPPTVTDVPIVTAPSNVAASPPPEQQTIDQPIVTDEPVSESTSLEGIDKSEHIQSPEPLKQETQLDIPVENEQETPAPSLSVESTEISQITEAPSSDVAAVQKEDASHGEMEVETGEAEPSAEVEDAEKEQHLSASISIPEQENVVCENDKDEEEVDSMEVEDSAEGQPAQSERLEGESQPCNEAVESSDVERDTRDHQQVPLQDQVSSTMVEPDETSFMQESAGIYQERTLESAASIEAPTSPQDTSETDTHVLAMERDAPPQDIQEVAAFNDEVVQPPREHGSPKDTQDKAEPSESATGSLVEESSRDEHLHESKQSPNNPDQDIVSKQSPAQIPGAVTDSATGQEEQGVTDRPSPDVEEADSPTIQNHPVSISPQDQNVLEQSPATETIQPEDMDVIQSTTGDLGSIYPSDQDISEQVHVPTGESEQPSVVVPEQPPAVESPVAETEQSPVVEPEEPPAVVELEEPAAIDSEQSPTVESQEPPAVEPEYSSLPDHTPSVNPPPPISEQDVHVPEDTLAQDEDVSEPLPAETAVEQLPIQDMASHVHDQTIPEIPQEQEQPNNQEKSNYHDTTAESAAPLKEDQDMPMESSPSLQEQDIPSSPPVDKNQEPSNDSPEPTAAVQEEPPSTKNLQQDETEVVMKEQEADTPEESGPSEPQQVELEQNTPVKAVVDTTTADTVPTSSKEMEQVSQTTLQIDDVLVHAEEDDLSVFSTEAAEADLVLTNLTSSNPSQQQRTSSGKGRSTHNVVHEQVGTSSLSSSSRARKSSSESSRLVSSSSNEKRSRLDKEEGHAEAPSVKRRRISTHAPGSSSSSVGAVSTQERKRRWGSAKQRSNSASTPTATISSDVLKDIIPTDMEGIVVGEDSDIMTIEGLSSEGGGGEQDTRDEEEATGISGGDGSGVVGSAADREWQEVEKERDIKRREVERARQELETRRRIEARLRAKQEADAKARRETIVKEEKRSPSPARNPKTRILHVENLTRPFTKMQLIELLTADGPIIEDAYWTNRVKSHCIVVYKSENTAVATRQRLHGIKWPSTNPKRLNVDFLTPDRVAMITEGQLIVDEITEGEEEVHEVKTEEVETMDTAEEETIKAKDNDTTVPPPSVPPPAEDNEVKVNDKTDEGTAEAAEEPKKGTKLLDELFKKTKATPSIYWLPLTDAQVAEREAEERAREEEREKQREERIRLRREEREKEDKEREQRLQAERERRARERMRRRRSRSRSHSRSKSRSRNRSRSRSRDRGRRR